MLVKEFVALVLSRFDKINKQDRPTLNILVRVDSGIEFKALMDELHIFQEKQPDGEVSAETLAPLIAFLEERWKSVRLTNALYCHTPDSRGTNADLVLAEEIARVTGKHAYDYLFPTVRASEYKTSKGTLYDLKLHEFVFADVVAAKPVGSYYAGMSGRSLTLLEALSGEVGEPVEILKCLEAAENDVHRELKKTCMTHSSLNESEVARVKGHSVAARDYYIAIKSPRCYNVDLQRKKFNEAINDPDKYEVLSSYGLDGEQRLLAVILSKLDKLERDKLEHDNLEKLTDLLCRFVPQNEWVSFLEKINRNKLNELVMGNPKFDPDEFAAKVKKANNYSRLQRDNAAVLTCFAQVYKNNRELDPAPVRSITGWIFSQPKKSEKLDAVCLVLNYLASDQLMTLKEFHDAQKCPEGVGDCAWKETQRRRWNAITEGSLGAVAEAVQERIKVQVPAVASVSSSRLALA